MPGTTHLRQKFESKFLALHHAAGTAAPAAAMSSFFTRGRSMFSMLTPTTNKASGSSSLGDGIDLCFSSEQPHLRQLWNAIPPKPQPDVVGLDRLCAILWSCAEQPSVLSITHAGAEEPVLPTIIAYLGHANGILSAAADSAEGSATPRALPWRDCGGAVALIHAVASLFVQLSGTPQYRLLLLQHELPSHLRHCISRLADCLAVLSGPPPPDAPRESFDPAMQSQSLAVLYALQLCTLLLGCLWQAGFAALHAHDAAEGRRPAHLPRLPDSVEELLRAPTAALGLGIDAPIGGTSSGGHHDLSAAAAQTREHVHQLLRLLKLSHSLQSEQPLGSSCWGLAVRLHRLSAAALGVLLPGAAGSEAAFLQQHGVSALLMCLHPHAHEEESLLEGDGRIRAADSHRQLLQLQIQCLLVALQGGPLSSAAWRASWTDAGGTFLLSRMLRRVVRLFDGASSLPSVDAAAAGGAASSAAARRQQQSSPQPIDDAVLDAVAAESLLERVASEVGAWTVGTSARQLTEWWQGVRPPPAPSSLSGAEWLMAADLVEMSAAAEAASAAKLPELSIVVGCLRAICEGGASAQPSPSKSSAPPLERQRSRAKKDAAGGGGGSSSSRDNGLEIAPSADDNDARVAALEIMANETQEAILQAILDAFMPADDNDDSVSEGSATTTVTAGGQLAVLSMLREFGASVVLPSAALAPRAVRLLSSTRFVRSRSNSEEGSLWPDGAPTPPRVFSAACRLNAAGEVVDAEDGGSTIDLLAPIRMLALHQLRTLVVSPRLHPDAAAACASALLAAVEAQLAGVEDALKYEHVDAPKEVHALRALLLCFCDLAAALRQRAPPAPPIPIEPAGQMPADWNSVLVLLARLLRDLALRTALRSARPSSTTTTSAVVGLDGLICYACEHAMAIPLLSRWALQQMDGPSSLFAALVELLNTTDSEATADTPGPIARFALRHVVGLLCHAALECRLEGELQGQLVSSDNISSSLPAWGIGVRLFQRFVGLFQPRVGYPRALRALLLDGIDRLVHREAAALQERSSPRMMSPQQALGESFSQRLLRECGVWNHLVSALDAEAALSARSFVTLLLHLLHVLPVLTWGAPQAQAAFNAAVGPEKMLSLLMRAGSPTGLPVISALFNWFAGVLPRVDHRKASEVPLGTAWSSDQGTAWLSPHQSTVLVGDVARLLLALLPHAEEHLQLDLLQRLGSLLDASILNRSRCAELRLLRQMLQLLSTQLSAETQRALLRALTPLASHSVSVSELKLLFSLLAQQPTEEASGDTLHAELLSTIGSMLRQHGPAASFIFDGHNSGLLLPPLPKLPTSGYTFCVWLRVDSLMPPAIVTSAPEAAPAATSASADAGGPRRELVSKAALLA